MVKAGSVRRKISAQLAHSSSKSRAELHRLALGLGLGLANPNPNPNPNPNLHRKPSAREGSICEAGMQVSSCGSRTYISCRPKLALTGVGQPGGRAGVYLPARRGCCAAAGGSGTSGAARRRGAGRERAAPG